MPSRRAPTPQNRRARTAARTHWIRLTGVTHSTLISESPASRLMPTWLTAQSPNTQ